MDQTDVPIVNLINNTDTEYPALIPIHYPKTGGTNPSVRLGVIPTQGGDAVWIDVPGDKRDNYIADVDYIASTGEIIFQLLNRPQNHLQIMTADPVTGTTTPLFEDKDEAWIDISQHLKWVNNGSQFLMLSERGGWRQLYLVSKEGGSPPLLLTPEAADVEAVLGVDEERGVVYFSASPTDPLRRYLFSVPLTGGQMTRVTPLEESFVGTNSYSLSGDAKFAVHSFSSNSTPPVTAIVALPSHETVCVLATNAKLKEKIDGLGLSALEFFRVDVGDGVELDGWGMFPPSFDPSQVSE